MSFLQSLFGAPVDHTEAVKAALAKGAPIVDVRSRHEFAGRHIPGAVNIPHDQIAARTGEVGPKNRPVVLYCRSGARSGMAARVLRSAGFSEVIDVGSIGKFPMGALEN
ncbi:MAG: rhodanese-like domain-containing protein [Deltaproteobacteria bacterium]|nr:rhodanese-like domain-containing protein [Deltaproteobacteria bacterium]